MKITMILRISVTGIHRQTSTQTCRKTIS